MNFQKAQVYQNGRFVQTDCSISTPILSDSVSIFENCIIIPGFVDVHVHLREPGFSYKETIASGTKAAARSGYSVVCTMPNLNPVPDSVKSLEEQLEIIRRDAHIRVLPYGALTVGEQGQVLADLEGLAPQVVAFSDDGRGVQGEEMMRQAMVTAQKLGKIIAAHCEEQSLVRGGYIHDGLYAAAHGHRGICSESEWRPIERDLSLAEQTGCAYHVCHVSCRESVALIRKAKARGVDVTCETAPHYLVLDEGDLQEDGRFKMNPPLRSAADREALLEGLLDGTIDMIATDHAPHSAEEKAKGLAGSAMGIVGLETAFPILYTELVKTGLLPLERLITCMSIAPRRRFGISEDDDFAVFDLTQAYKIDPEGFLSKGKSTPFAGRQVYGKCLLNQVGGKIVWQDSSTEN